MKIGILGSGVVGQSLGAGLVKIGHEVRLGTRDKEKLKDWLAKAGKKASAGSFEDAVKFGEAVFICVKGEGAENAITVAGITNFNNKIVVDVTNPLVHEKEGEAPTLGIAYPNSLGATIQDMLPLSMVVKAFNTVPAHYMANPKLEEGKPDLFIAGNDDAKELVKEIAEKWGWSVVDIGGIEQAYLLEALAMIWIRYGFLNNHWNHAFKLLRK